MLAPWYVYGVYKDKDPFTYLKMAEDIPYARSVYESESMSLPVFVDYFIILIPPEAHEPWKVPERWYGKLLTYKNPYYIPTHLTILEGTSILYLNADTPWDAPHLHKVEVMDSSEELVYSTGMLNYTDSSEPKVLPVGEYTITNTEHETYNQKTKSAVDAIEKATISVKRSSNHKDRKKRNLVVGGFYTPTDHVINNMDKHGQFHSGWLGYYAEEFPKNGFTILSQYNFLDSAFLGLPAEFYASWTPWNHTLLIYSTDQPIQDVLTKLKQMIVNNAYITDQRYMESK